MFLLVSYNPMLSFIECKLYPISFCKLKSLFSFCYNVKLDIEWTHIYNTLKNQKHVREAKYNYDRHMRI